MPLQPEPRSPSAAVIRGTCIALRTPENAGVSSPWQALLLRGPSGAGKSDLALRILHDRGADAALIADDYVEFTVNGSPDPGGRQADMFAAPPPAIEGLLEVRGVGIVRLPFVSDIPLKLVVDLVAPNALDRLPEPECTSVLAERTDIQLPVLKCAPFEASAVAKICLAMHGEIAEGATPGTGIGTRDAEL